jgi:hypothetical protein
MRAAMHHRNNMFREILRLKSVVMVVSIQSVDDGVEQNDPLD